MVQKKSLISNRATVKKALLASRPQVKITPTPAAKLESVNIGKFAGAKFRIKEQ